MINGNSLILKVGKENSYGVIPIPTRQIKVASESLKPNYNKKDEGLLTGGKAGGKKETMSLKTEGSISTLARPDDVGLFLMAALGVEGEVEKLVDKNNSYKHTFTAIGTAETDSLPSLSFVLDRKTKVFSYNGMKIDSLSFSAAPEDYLKLDLTLVGKDEAYYTDTTTLNTSPLKSFKFRHGKVYIGTEELADVTSIKLNYSNALDSSTQTTSTGLYYKEPQVGTREIKSDVELLYTKDSEKFREEFYKSDKTVKIVLEFISDEIIEDDVHYSLKFTIPCNQVEDASANFGDQSTIKQSMTFSALENGIDELITVELINGYADKY